MIAAIPAEDRPTLIEQRVPEHMRDALLLRGARIIQATHGSAAETRTCISCGAKTDPDGALPCDH